MNKSNISRKFYLDQIQDFIGTDLVKILIGQRRVGKSYILRQIIDYLISEKWVKTDEICYINKEDMIWDYIRWYEDLHKAISPYRYIFIDEIQDIVDWEKAIRSLQATGAHDIYITGSNSRLLSGEFASYLGGRYVSFQIYPLTYREFLEFHEIKRSTDSFQDYIHFGGLPYLKNLPLKDEVIRSYLRDIIDTIILKDIVSRHNIRNVPFFKRLITYLAKETGSIFSAKSISDYLKNQSTSISPNIILDYLSFSEEANFLHEVSRYDIKGKKTFELKHKFFFTDIGIKNALIGGYNGVDISGILENVVFIHLIANGWQVKIGEFDGKEVDFVCEKNDQTMYVQVAYLLESEETKTREFASLLAITDHHPKYVITMDQWASGNIEGVQWKGIEEFIYEL